MKILSLFSGIGAFEKALKNLGIDFDLVGFCEIDKYAAKSYCAIHDVPETMNLGDITKVDTSQLPNDIDLITYGFPCQDISIAGKQKGLIDDDGNQTRSGLFFEALRIIEDAKPKIAIAENVKNLVGKKFNAQFQVVLASLEAAGYNNYWKVLNAKHYGIPQNRERVFIVSIRKDIDRGLFQFPVPIALDKRLKDVLETVVDEKYYLSDKMIEGFLKHNDNHNAKGTGFLWKPKSEDDIANCLRANASLCPTDNTVVTDRVLKVGSVNSSQDGVVVSAEGIAPTHTAGHGNTPKIAVESALRQVGQLYPNSGNPQAGRVYDADGLCPTIDTCDGGNRMPKVAICEATKKGYTEAGDWDSINLEFSNKQYRKLTPKECFRLFGFDDEDYERAKNVLNEAFYKGKNKSDSRLYKQTGNSIVVDVLEAIFRQMLDEDGRLLV